MRAGAANEAVASVIPTDVERIPTHARTFGHRDDAVDQEFPATSPSFTRRERYCSDTTHTPYGLLGTDGG